MQLLSTRLINHNNPQSDRVKRRMQHTSKEVKDREAGKGRTWWYDMLTICNLPILASCFSGNFKKDFINGTHVKVRFETGREMYSGLTTSQKCSWAMRREWQKSPQAIIYIMCIVTAIAVSFRSRNSFNFRLYWLSVVSVFSGSFLIQEAPCWSSWGSNISDPQHYLSRPLS